MKLLSNLTHSLKTHLNIYWFYSVVIFILGLDQISKFLIENNLGPYGSGKTYQVFSGLVFNYSKNSGAAGNFLEEAPWLFATVATLAAIGMVVYYHRFSQKTFWFGFSIGLVLGGTLGNLTDRIFKNGFVTDFITVYWLGPNKSFNLSDLSLQVGMVIFVLTLLFSSKKAGEKTSNLTTPLK